MRDFLKLSFGMVLMAAAIAGIFREPAEAQSHAPTVTPAPAIEGRHYLPGQITSGRGGTGFVFQGPGESTSISNNQPTTSFLVEYTTTEPDYNSPYRELAMCSAPGGCGADFNVPRKTVTHYEPFSSAKAAIEWVNCWAGCKASYDSGSGNITITVGLAYPKAFIRLLAVHPVSVSSETTTKEIPQPAVKETKTEYRLKEQK